MVVDDVDGFVQLGQRERFGAGGVVIFEHAAFDDRLTVGRKSFDPADDDDPGSVGRRFDFAGGGRDGGDAADIQGRIGFYGFGAVKFLRMAEDFDGVAVGRKSRHQQSPLVWGFLSVRPSRRRILASSDPGANEAAGPGRAAGTVS